MPLELYMEREHQFYLEISVGLIFETYNRNSNRVRTAPSNPFSLFKSEVE